MRFPGLGLLKYHLLTRPRDAREIQRGKANLPHIRAAVTRLKPLPPPRETTEPIPTVNYLTGSNFLYQTIYSAYSLIALGQATVGLRIINDDSLSSADIEVLHRIFPDRIRVEPLDAQEAIMESIFPRSRFPALRLSRDEGALWRKLTDVHGGRSGWTTFIDSDTFFYRPPVRLFADRQLSAPALYSADHHSNYGLPIPVLSKIIGHSVRERINSGLVKLKSDSIDWEKMEFWLSQMRANAVHPNFLEQGLTALHLSFGAAEALPETDYKLTPSIHEVRRPTAVFHHFAGNSKFRFLCSEHPLRMLSLYFNP